MQASDSGAPMPPACYAPRPMTTDWTPLLEAARQARDHAYAPYSEYRVGAALLCEGGEVFAGANVENGIPALGVCAERSAVSAAVTAGCRKIVAVAVVTASRPPARPCGVCRQTLLELAADPATLPILCAGTGGEREETTLGELLPQPFVYAREKESGTGS